MTQTEKQRRDTRATQGRSFKLFFINDKPDGMQTAESINWVGHVLLTPRTQIAEALNRNHAKYTGVYLLLDDNSESGKSMLYVGEGEDMSSRIRDHDSKRDWWTKAVLITTQSNTLNKAHVLYLETRLVEIAGDVGRVSLDNKQQDRRVTLSEADQNAMEVFLQNLMMVLPAVRIDCFLERSRPTPASAVPGDHETPVFEFTIKRHGVKAIAIIENGEMIVQEGSIVRGEWMSDSVPHRSYGDLHGELIRSGVLQRRDDGKTVFTCNYAFTNPSAAGAVVAGRPSSATTDWKLQGSGKTYRDWEAERLNATV